MKCYVFAYGTLRDAKVRKDVIGYDVPAFRASVKGFRRSSIMLQGISYPQLIRQGKPAEQVFGVAFEIAETELIKLDKYESGAYRRIITDLNSGTKAWVYIK